MIWKKSAECKVTMKQKPDIQRGSTVVFCWWGGGGNIGLNGERCGVSVHALDL